MISTSELDNIVRLGLEDCRRCLSGAAKADDFERAKLAITLLGKSTGRMSAENNRIEVGMRLAKMLNIPLNDQTELWNEFRASRKGIEGEK